MQMREAPLELLHAKQITLLRQLRASESPDESLVDASLLVVNAIANGLRTTG